MHNKISNSNSTLRLVKYYLPKKSRIQAQDLNFQGEFEFSRR